MNAEPERPLDLWKETTPMPPAVPADRQPLPAHPAPPPTQPPPHMPVAEPRDLYPYPQHPTGPHYAQPVAESQYPQHPTGPHYAQPVSGPQYPQHPTAPYYAQPVAGPQYPPQPAMYPQMNIVQNNAGYGGPIVQRAFPHGLHLVLSLITCGLWLPVWLIHYLVAGNR